MKNWSVSSQCLHAAPVGKAREGAGRRQAGPGHPGVRAGQEPERGDGR
jgi:hypothetical protein